MSKGSWRRKSMVPNDVFGKNWDKIFRKEKSDNDKNSEKDQREKSKRKTKGE